MKICSTCGFECEDEHTVCPTCGKSCDGSDPKKDIPLSPDPFEEYRKQIDRQIREQENRINEIKERISSENTEEKKQKETIEKSKWDKTELFSVNEVNQYRLVAVLVYLTGMLGIIIALLTDKKSEYLKFHIKEGIKIAVVSAVLAICSFLLCWTFVVPFLCAVGLILLAVVSVISAVWTLEGKSKNAVIIRNLTILN